MSTATAAPVRPSHTNSPRPGKPMLETVDICTGQPYTVHIGPGLLDQVGNLTSQAVGGPFDCIRRAFVVTDDIVDELYGDRVIESLIRAGFSVQSYVFPHGEENKTLDTYTDIVSAMTKAGITRNDICVALGGGVVGDMAGFAAATFQRGIDFVQVPTTVLAAVDSSVGGKTAVDLPQGKNLVGAFHQPRAVICDSDVLSVLPHAVAADGMAEMLKYGVLCDPDLFYALATQGGAAITPQTIARCVAIKKHYVEVDEHEHGERMLLNLGHTLGHAMEQLSGFSIPHGQAVAFGMLMMAQIMEREQIAEAGVAKDIADAITGIGLSAQLPYAPAELKSALRADKKRSGENITLVGIRAIGDCTLQPLALTEVDTLLR